MTMGIDFKGKTSSAVARPPLSGRMAEVFSRRLEVAPSMLLPFLSLQWRWWIQKYPNFHGQNTLPKYLVKMRCWYQQGLFLLFLGPHGLTWQLYLPNVQLALIRSDHRKKTLLKMNQVMGWMEIHIKEGVA